MDSCARPSRARSLVELTRVARFEIAGCGSPPRASIADALRATTARGGRWGTRRDGTRRVDGRESRIVPRFAPSGRDVVDSIATVPSAAPSRAGRARPVLGDGVGGDVSPRTPDVSRPVRPRRRRAPFRSRARVSGHPRRARSRVPRRRAPGQDELSARGGAPAGRRLGRRRRRRARRARLDRRLDRKSRGDVRSFVAPPAPPRAPRARARRRGSRPRLVRVDATRARPSLLPPRRGSPRGCLLDRHVSHRHVPPRRASLRPPRPRLRRVGPLRARAPRRRRRASSRPGRRGRRRRVSHPRRRTQTMRSNTTSATRSRRRRARLSTRRPGGERVSRATPRGPRAGASRRRRRRRRE